MKRFVNVIAFMLFMVGIKAQVRDAFDGILPVTDPQMKRSLNGEWQLKVVQGISDDQTLPMADETWGPRCYTISRSLNNILFPRASRLHHLVYGAVAKSRQESSCKDIGHSVEHHRLLIKPQIVPVGLLAQY